MGDEVQESTQKFVCQMERTATTMIFLVCYSLLPSRVAAHLHVAEASLSVVAAGGLESVSEHGYNHMRIIWKACQ